LETTIARWQSEQIVNWLYSIGLGQYASECRKYYKNGLQLLHATPQELDKVKKTILFLKQKFDELNSRKWVCAIQYIEKNYNYV
jgi:hypothetical protein